MHRFKCRVCGEKFETEDPKQHVCPGKHFNTCLTCGKKFPVALDGRKADYCSARCQNNPPESVLKEKYGTRICETCGKEFVPKQKTQKICSTVHYLPCPVCGKIVKVLGHKKSRCCSNECTQALKRKTCMEKYGVPVSSQAKEVKDKAERTFMERYGTKTASQNEEIKKKVKDQWEAKYGTDNPMRLESIKEKQRKTNLERYGAEHPWKNKEVLEKRRKTFIEKYGASTPSKNPEIIKKSKATMLERYGVDNAAKLDSVKDKIRATQFAHYGTWYFNTDENSRNSSRPVSSRNIKFSDLFQTSGIFTSMEFYFDDAKRRKFDISINDTNILIELDSTAVHNSYKNVHQSIEYTNEITDIQLNKSKLAWNHGYNCIHVFDWDGFDEIMRYVKPHMYKLPASFLHSVDVDYDEACEFFKSNDVQLFDSSNFTNIKLFGIYSNPVYGVRYAVDENSVKCTVCVKNGYALDDASDLILSACESDSVTVLFDASKYTDVYGIGIATPAAESISLSEPRRLWSKNNEVIFDSSDTSYSGMIDSGYLPIHDCGIMSVNISKD